MRSSLVFGFLCLFPTIAFGDEVILADPTEPLSGFRAAKEEKKHAWKLDGIFFNEQRPFAIINGVTVHQGSVIRLARVLSIHRHHVELSGVEGEFSLTLHKPILRRASGVND